MIAFGVCIGSPEKYAACALPGLRRCAEPDSPVAEATDQASIFVAYNQMLEAFAALPALEALVLMHEDVELLDPDFGLRVRALVGLPDVAVVGAVGARGVRSLAWWEGEGFGRARETRGAVDFGGGVHEVDAVDGLMLVLSPWAVRNLRFDDGAFVGFHGYDVDLCFAARARGKRVLVGDFELFHHTKGGYGDAGAWQSANATWQAKWGPPGRLAAG